MKNQIKTILAYREITDGRGRVHEQDNTEASYKGYRERQVWESIRHSLDNSWNPEIQRSCNLLDAYHII